MSMIIKNVQVYMEDGRFRPGSVRIKGDRIAQICLEEEGSFQATSADTCESCLEGHGLYLIPGMIDIHLHGCRGYDFCDGTLEAVAEIARYQASIGVTTFVPATMTLPLEQLKDVLKMSTLYVRRSEQRGLGRHAKLAGINMEGPFISKEKKGAQKESYILSPDVAIFEELQQVADGLIKYIGIAPEAEGALEFIKSVRERTAITIAHSAADYETARKAIQLGVRHVTHLYNGMPPFHHRKPGIVGAVMESKGVEAELICDGVHVHPAVIRSTFSILGEDRIILISDSMRAAGMSDGYYELGGQKVTVQGNQALLEDGTLAGSVTTLPDCLRYVVREVGIPLERAVGCVTANPAKSLGIYGEYGSISEGKKADLVLLGRKLETVAVMKDGQLII